jgi:hypothetical protein
MDHPDAREKRAPCDDERRETVTQITSERGNPGMDNLAAIFDVVRKHLGVDIRVRAMKAA